MSKLKLHFLISLKIFPPWRTGDGVLKVGPLKVSSTQVFSVRTLVVSMKRRRCPNTVAKAERVAWVKQRIQCA
jgi:hypothetical protein